jgi:quercetin dioxygenase-like cupin family protein
VTDFSAANPIHRVSSVEEVSTLGFDWGTIRWLVSGQQIKDAQITFGFVEISARARNVRHYHPNCDEVLYVLQGELDHGLEDEVFHLTPGMAIHIPSGVWHSAINRSEVVARVVVAYSTGDRQTVMAESSTST